MLCSLLFRSIQVKPVASNWYVGLKLLATKRLIAISELPHNFFFLLKSRNKYELKLYVKNC